MDHSRREAVKVGGALLALLAGAGVCRPDVAFAQASSSRAAFDARAVADALKALGAQAAAQSKEVAIQAADIAENGAVVPVTVTSSLPRTEQIAILVEKNPNVLAALFEIAPAVEPSVSTRVKLSQTSNVFALVRADGRYFVAIKEVKVTLGGCG